MNKWRIKEDWIELLLGLYIIGGILVPIIIQAIVAPDGMNGGDASPGLITLACWFGPAILIGIGVFVRYLVSLGFPIERVDESEDEEDK